MKCKLLILIILLSQYSVADIPDLDIQKIRMDVENASAHPNIILSDQDEHQNLFTLFRVKSGDTPQFKMVEMKAIKFRDENEKYVVANIRISCENEKQSIFAKLYDKDGKFLKNATSTLPFDIHSFLGQAVCADHEK
mgnify:CR=1 FL=1